MDYTATHATLFASERPPPGDLRQHRLGPGMAYTHLAALLRCRRHRWGRAWSCDGVFPGQEAWSTSGGAAGTRPHRPGQFGSQHPGHALELFLSRQLELFRPLAAALRETGSGAEFQRHAAAGRPDQPGAFAA